MLFGLFERMVPAFPEAPPGAPPTTLWAFVWHYARPFRFLFAGSAVLTMLLALIEVYAFSTVGQIVDWAQDASAAQFWADHGGQILLVSVLIAIGWPLAALLDDLCQIQGVLGNMAMATRWRMHRYLLRQSPSFFADEFAGRIATKVMQTALSARDTVLKLCNVVVYLVVYFVTTMTLLIGNDARLAIPLLLWITIYAGIFALFMPKIRVWSERQSDARSSLTGRVVDAYANIQTVKMFGTQAAEENYAREGMQAMLDTVYPNMRIITGLLFSLHVLNGLFIAGSLLLGVWLWSTGAVTAGGFAFAVAMSLRIQAMSHYFMFELSNLFENIGTTMDGLSMMKRPITINDAPAARTLVAQKGEIRFEAVTFRYGGERQVISDLNLAIRPGEKVGLVGRSGAGKSTIVNLLLRFYDVEKGRVLIDGENIAEVTQESLRAAMGVVTQDTSLLHRSIRENIAYGRPGASDAEILAAARRAAAEDFILRLEDQNGRRGLDAHVGERGIKLSGGQRQRIAIARVLLKNAPILILDEATSALDSEVEAAIQSQLALLMDGKTVLAIAHRLSTVAAMDRLIVLEGGCIVEEGPHAALLTRGGLYAQLWERQSGGFLDTGAGTSAGMAAE